MFTVLPRDAVHSLTRWAR